MTTADPSAPPSSPRWPWACFALAAVWTVLIRAPLILNAPAHVDSDLAVDGLTLAEAAAGHWRWHYPGTPHIGSAGVVLSIVQAKFLGPTPEALVSGGTVAAVGVLLGTFLLTWNAFGPRQAAWSLIPLTFASSGMVWLSGRITGGHLLAAAWHAGAFGLFVRCSRHGGFGRALAFGLWSGLGLFVDSMFAVSLAALLPLLGFDTYLRGRRWGPLVAGLVIGLAVGVLPREIGKLYEPYNAYGPQFEVVTDRELLLGHAGLLVRDCLPRLIAGHRLPGLETEPDPTGLTAPSVYRTPEPVGVVAAATTGVSLFLWLGATLALGVSAFRGPDPAARRMAAGLLLSGLATIAAFVVNRNIFNSDNYRYLVTLLVPWGVGFGVLMRWLSRTRVLPALCALTFAGLMTVDLGHWYARFGWVDDNRLPARAPVNDPVLDWLAANPEARWIEAGYWDVYRQAFLSRGRVRGRPFAIYPDRFPEWAPEPGTDRFVLGRPTAEGRLFLDRAARDGGKTVPGPRGLSVLRVPHPPRPDPERPE